MGSRVPFDLSQFKAGFEPQEVQLDDVTVVGLGGASRTPWAGESVWLEPFLDPEDEIALSRSYVAFRMPTDGDDLDEKFDQLCDVLSRLVYAWNLTDKHGVALPQPHHNPDAFRAMPSRLMLALVERALGIGTYGGATEGKVSNGSGRGSTKSRARASR